jgi:hypothetical protein
MTDDTELRRLRRLRRLAREITASLQADIDREPMGELLKWQPPLSGT